MYSNLIKAHNLSSYYQFQLITHDMPTMAAALWQILSNKSLIVEGRVAINVLRDLLLLLYRPVPSRSVVDKKFKIGNKLLGEWVQLHISFHIVCNFYFLKQFMWLPVAFLGNKNPSKMGSTLKEKNLYGGRGDSFFPLTL